MTEVVAPPNIGTLPSMEDVLVELHKEQEKAQALAHGEGPAGDEREKEEVAGLKFLEEMHATVQAAQAKAKATAPETENDVSEEPKAGDIPAEDAEEENPHDLDPKAANDVVEGSSAEEEAVTAEVDSEAPAASVEETSHVTAESHEDEVTPMSTEGEDNSPSKEEEHQETAPNVQTEQLEVSNEADGAPEEGAKADQDEDVEEPSEAPAVDVPAEEEPQSSSDDAPAPAAEPESEPAPAEDQTTVAEPDAEVEAEDAAGEEKEATQDPAAGATEEENEDVEEAKPEESSADTKIEAQEEPVGVHEEDMLVEVDEPSHPALDEKAEPTSETVNEEIVAEETHPSKDEPTETGPVEADAEIVEHPAQEANEEAEAPPVAEAEPEPIEAGTKVEEPLAEAEVTEQPTEDSNEQAEASQIVEDDPSEEVVQEEVGGAPAVDEVKLVEDEGTVATEPHVEAASEAAQENVVIEPVADEINPLNDEPSQAEANVEEPPAEESNEYAETSQVAVDEPSEEAGQEEVVIPSVVDEVELVEEVETEDTEPSAEGAITSEDQTTTEHVESEVSPPTEKEDDEVEETPAEADEPTSESIPTEALDTEVAVASEEPVIDSTPEPEKESESAVQTEEVIPASESEQAEEQPEHVHEVEGEAEESHLPVEDGALAMDVDVASELRGDVVAEEPADEVVPNAEEIEAPVLAEAEGADEAPVEEENIGEAVKEEEAEQPEVEEAQQEPTEVGLEQVPATESEQESQQAVEEPEQEIASSVETEVIEDVTPAPEVAPQVVQDEAAEPGECKADELPEDVAVKSSTTAEEPVLEETEAELLVSETSEAAPSETPVERLLVEDEPPAPEATDASAAAGESADAVGEPANEEESEATTSHEVEASTGIESLSSIPTESTEVVEAAPAAETVPVDEDQEVAPAEEVVEELPQAEISDPSEAPVEPAAIPEPEILAEAEIEHKEIVPNVEVEVATPSSDVLSFSDDEALPSDAPLEQRLAEAAGLQFSTAQELLSDLKITAPEQTTIPEEDVTTPTAPSADTLPEAPVDQETGNIAHEEKSVDESAIVFTEPTEEDEENITHAKKESVDLSTIVFTEPQAESETSTEEEIEAPAEPVDLSTLAFTEPLSEEMDGKMAAAAPTLSVDTTTEEVPERPRSPYTPAFSVMTQGVSPVHPSIEELPVAPEEVEEEPVVDDKSEEAENVIVTPPAEEAAEEALSTGENEATAVPAEEPDVEVEPIERGSFIEESDEKPSLAIDTTPGELPDRPRSPYTPSFSVTNQGPGFPQAEESTEETEEAAVSEHITSPAQEATPISAAAIEERPKSPYPAAYTVTQMGPGISTENDKPDESEDESSMPAVASDEGHNNSLSLNLTPATDVSDEPVSVSDVPEAPSSPRSDLGSVTPGFDSRSEISCASHSPIPPDSPRGEPGSAISTETENEVRTPLTKAVDVVQPIEAATSPLRTPLPLQTMELEDENAEKVTLIESDVHEFKEGEEHALAAEESAKDETEEQEAPTPASTHVPESAFTGSLSELESITETTHPGSVSEIPDISSSSELVVPKLVVLDAKPSAPVVAVVNTLSTDSAFSQLTDMLSPSQETGTNFTTPDIGTLDMPKVDMHEGSDVASIEPLDEDAGSPTERVMSPETTVTPKGDSTKPLGIMHTLAMRSFPSAFNSDAVSPTASEQQQQPPIQTAGTGTTPEGVKLSPPTERRRLESTTSNLYFPGGWVASPSQKERPSLEVATGEFSRPVLEGSVVASSATAEVDEEREATKPESKGWRCIIM